MMDGQAFEDVMAGLGPWPTDRRVAVAVSGGADSVCLALLAAHWGRPVGLIVDHGLRAGSAQEADLARQRLAGFGVPAIVLTLSGLAHGPGLAARARRARYAALIDAARHLGLSDILVGHHARDQAETVLIRRDGHSGASGLAGMAAILDMTAVRLVRPLLGTAPGLLRDHLHARGIGWTEDPSNRDRAALRTRTRLALDDPSGDGPATTALVGQAACHAARRAALERQAADELARRACLFPQGYALLSPGPIGAETLAALIRALSGAAYPPPTGSVVRLAARSACGKLIGTVAGVRFLPAGRLGPGTLAVREEAAMAPPVAARDGAVWDGRFRLSAPDGLSPGAEIGALLADARGDGRHAGLPSCVVRTLPAIRLQGALLACSHLQQSAADGDKGWTNPRLRLTFEPCVPAMGAPFGPCPPGDAQAQAQHYLG